jgi:hypothetical protein
MKSIRFHKKRAIKRSLFGRSLCFVRLFQSVVPPSVPQALQQHREITALKKKPLFLCAVFVPHLHTVTSCVRRDYCIHNTASFVTLRKLRFTSFSSIMSAVPCCFSGCSLNLPSRLAPLALCPKSRNAPQKAGLHLIFSVPFHAHSPYAVPQAPLLPVLWWLFDYRNTATALLVKKIP